MKQITDERVCDSQIYISDMIWDKMNVSDTGLFVFKKYIISRHRARHMQSHASQSSQQEALPLGLKSEGSSGDVRVWRTPALQFLSAANLNVIFAGL